MLIFGFARNQKGRHIPSVIVDLISRFYNFELFKFGGLDLHDGQCVDSFFIGKLKNGNPSEPIQWQSAPEYKLKHPMRAFGYIQHGPFILTFGGISDGDSRAGANRHTDDIYILDLRKDCGWVLSSVKCPQKARFHAVLDKKQRIHLHERIYGNQNHYCISLDEIIDSKMETVDNRQDSWVIMHVFLIVSAIVILYLHSRCFQ